MKKKFNVIILLPLILILAACSGMKLPGASQVSGASSSSNTTTQQGQNQLGQGFSMANQPLEQKLALGTLKLEGTDKAITADQAKTILPLWKAVKTMSSSSNTSQDEMNAVYKQIEEVLTASQLQAIKDLNLSQTDLQALMTQYGIQPPQMKNASGTPVAQSQSGSRSSGTGGTGGAQAGGQGGFPAGDAGGPPPDGGGFPGGGQPGQSNAQGSAQGSAQGTPRARPAGGGFRGGMNFMFVDPLIKVLEQRAGG